MYDTVAAGRSSAVVVAAVVLLMPVAALPEEISGRPAQSQTDTGAVKKIPGGGGATILLSVNECKALGGTAYQDGAHAKACNSGIVCTTKDQNGNVHNVCVSK